MANCLNGKSMSVTTWASVHTKATCTRVYNINICIYLCISMEGGAMY